VSRVHDRLDDLLDGRPGPVDPELLPLLEVAERLRTEVQPLRLDPGLAEEHLRRALTIRSRPAGARTRPGRPHPWRRRAVAAALAATLASIPAVGASASSVPGDALWPVKQAVDGVKVIAARSPEQVASLRVALAEERLEELALLLAAGRRGEVPAATRRLADAVGRAAAALRAARAGGVDSTSLAALESRLRALVTTAATLTGPTLATGGQPAAEQAPAAQHPRTRVPGTTVAPPPGAVAAPPPPAGVPVPATTLPLLTPSLPPVASTTTTTAPPVDPVEMDREAKRRQRREERRREREERREYERDKWNADD
jgi:hypothetical protein